jgi:Fe-S-cluster-containing hydrogenase component 2
LDAIGVKLDAPDCVQCLNCWWVCPKGALILTGEVNHMERQISRYKEAIERL